VQTRFMKIPIKEVFQYRGKYFIKECTQTAKEYFEGYQSTVVAFLPTTKVTICNPKELNGMVNNEPG